MTILLIRIHTKDKGQNPELPLCACNCIALTVWECVTPLPPSCPLVLTLSPGSALNHQIPPVACVIPTPRLQLLKIKSRATESALLQKTESGACSVAKVNVGLKQVFAGHRWLQTLLLVPAVHRTGFPSSGTLTL